MLRLRWVRRQVAVLAGALLPLLLHLGQPRLQQQRRPWRVDSRRSASAFCPAAELVTGQRPHHARRFLTVTPAPRRQRPRVVRAASSPFSGASSPEEDPWGVLGVAPGSSPKEVKRAYRARALEEHPDVSGRPDAKQRWAAVSKAYGVLSDPKKRQVLEARSREAFYRQEASRRERAARGRAGAGATAWASGAGAGAGSSSSSAGPAARGGSSARVEDVISEVMSRVPGAVGAAGASAARTSRTVVDEVTQRLGWSSIRGGTATASRLIFGRELRAAEARLGSLRQQEAGTRRDEVGWLRAMEEANATGDRYMELKAGNRVLEMRKQRGLYREQIRRCLDQIEYFERAIAES